MPGESGMGGFLVLRTYPIVIPSPYGCPGERLPG